MKVDASLPPVHLERRRRASPRPPKRSASTPCGPPKPCTTPSCPGPWSPSTRPAPAVRHSRRHCLCPQPGHPGLHRLGPGAGLRRALHPRPGHAGQGAYRAALRHALARFGRRQAARADRGPARLLENLADRRTAQLPRRILQADAHVALLQPRSDQTPPHPDLHRRGQHRPGAPGGRAGRRLPGAPLPHPAATCRKSCCPPCSRGWRKPGARAEALQVSATAFVVTCPEEEFFVRSQIAFYASTPSYRAVMALHGWDEIADQLSGLAGRGQWLEMPGLISDEMLDSFAVRRQPRPSCPPCSSSATPAWSTGWRCTCPSAPASATNSGRP